MNYKILFTAILLNFVAQAFGQQNYYDPNNPNSPNYNPYNSPQYNNTQSVQDSIANTQQDTTTYKEKKKWSWKNNPTVATLASVILPGAGQIYNKKYWKAPIVWGLIGVTAYFFTLSNGRYLDFREASFNAQGYLMKENGDPIVEKDKKKLIERYNDIQNDENGILFTEKNSKYISKWIDTIPSQDQYIASAVSSRRDQARQLRDYMGLAFLVSYVLNIVDAAVDAHFSDFDVSDKLSLKIEPRFISHLATPQIGLYASLKINAVSRREKRHFQKYLSE
ncbi:MAG: hypothetical protein EAZ53_15845 [Bacteroidetes bacterium]|nr:MAG: hypothetical protein EAZ53_15845 [Bacteroidota bacterium]